MKVSDGNGTQYHARISMAEWIKLLAAAAAVVAAIVGGLTFLGASPAAVRGNEARIKAIEMHQVEFASAMARIANKLDEHLEQTRTGYERISALEQHAKDVDRRLNGIGAHVMPPGQDDPDGSRK